MVLKVCFKLFLPSVLNISKEMRWNRKNEQKSKMMMMMMMMMISIPSSVSGLHPAIESRVYGKRQTANVNLYQKTKFSLYASFTVHYSFSKMSSFTPVLSLKTVLDSFYMLIFYLEKFST